MEIILQALYRIILVVTVWMGNRPIFIRLYIEFDWHAQDFELRGYCQAFLVMFFSADFVEGVGELIQVQWKASVVGFKVP